MIDMNSKFPVFRSWLRDRFTKTRSQYWLPSLEEYADAFKAAGLEIVQKRNFCWIPHSAGDLMLAVMRSVTPVLDRLVPSFAMRSVVVAQKPKPVEAGLTDSGRELCGVILQRAVIVLKHPDTASSEASVKIFLENLGVPSCQECDIEEFRGLTADSLAGPPGDALIAPFACLPWISSLDSSSKTRTLSVPPSVQGVFFHSFNPDRCPENLIRELIRDPKAQFQRMNPEPRDCLFASDPTEV